MTLWRCVVALLLSIKRCGPPLASCLRFDASLGNVSVEPPSPFVLGSNLTVYCHIATCQWRSKITLKFNEVPVDPWKRDKCSPAIFRLPSVQQPLSTVQCTLQEHGQWYLVDGADLLGGFPPDKPLNVTCATTRQSDLVECSWWRGRNTHVPTSYNVSFSRAKRTLAHFNLSQDHDRLVITRTLFAANETYQLIIAARNHFGRFQSDPYTFNLNDIVMPQSPRIEHIDFRNDSTSAAILRWKTPKALRHLRASVRLRQANGRWDVREAARLGEDAIRVDGLKPLTEYEFQMRACNSTLGVEAGRRSRCSKWSPSVTRRSPGKGPSKPLSAWRMLSNRKTSSLQTLTVLWKAPPPDSGEVEGYEISVGENPKQEVRCAASLSQCSLQVPADISALSVSVITTFGRSPPADVPLTLSGDLGPADMLLVPVANDSAVLLSWAGPEPGPGPGRREELEYYVTEWTSVPVGELRWQKVANYKNDVTIIGLMAGVRYNVSLYAVTCRGVSAPSSILVYSQELEPVSGPLMSVLVHKTGRIQIQWDDPAVEQQRGFITSYTVYLQTLDFHSTEISVTLSASGPRETWLDCPEGSLVLQMSASTSAGEGQRGNLISSQPVDPAVGLAVLVFTVVVFGAVLVQLVCWRCVRRRIKEKCASWLVPSLPKAGNSRAIKLLQLDVSEPSFSYSDSDPPLSPLSCISEEDMYPYVHKDQPVAQTSWLEAVAMATRADGYKPQLARVVRGGQTTEVSEVLGDRMEEGRRSSGFELLVSFHSGVELDYSMSPPRCLKTHHNLSRQTESGVEDNPTSVALKEGDVMAPPDAVFCSPRPVDATQTSGYIPQSAARCYQPACQQQPGSLTPR
ncbi:interleukin-12 receptor subunit beta-2-like isoform X2 [Dunckerocampus dactyliophorus]|uniref:interleukin-12 receptor subunit beta-2-like isoform X2 n=1 Tax=Dunckerocampus dactyliophorus TaxID=161453 RepID=UPI002406EF0B|nr:interleukin-12 receptor subunit beta-2-like isoform X2 [Dunckerocampus dactyliophorus]